MNYVVRWEIDLSADSPRAAALEALAIMRDPASTALTFDIARGQTSDKYLVYRLDERVDLGEEASDGN